jgi:L-lactate dehydrogenase complex protein LldG
MSARDAFLQRVRNAVAEGNRAGVAAPLPEQSRVGYQGAGADPVDRFCTELANAGGKAHLANSPADVVRILQSIVQLLGARKLLLSRGGMIDRLDLSAQLKQLGLEVHSAGDSANSKEEFFAADVGISNVYRLIAETGTVVVATSSNEPRSVSLLPPVHIAIAEHSQLLPDLFDLFDLFSPADASAKSPPACLTLITGPSKTGDIELRLVTGVHGPGEVHVILLDT